MLNSNLYVPKLVEIAYIKSESETVKSFGLKVDLDFKAGQFLQVSCLGAGEVPISISSSPEKKDFIELTIRNTGKITQAIHKLKKGSFLGLRGPYGNAFPIDEVYGEDLIFIAGGIGLAPLRSLVIYALNNYRKYRKINLLYGARRQGEFIFKNDLKKWQTSKKVGLYLTVDTASKGWNGNTGVVTELIDRVDVEPKNSVAFICGPPIMIKYTIAKLLEFGLRDEYIIVSLERYMKCGVGKCGHCYMVDKYVCVDGPVFSYNQLRDLKEVEPVIE